MSRIRVRRPLVALVALVAAVVIGYTVRAVHHDGHHPSPVHSTGALRAPTPGSGLN